jgi:hypothetical protein
MGSGHPREVGNGVGTKTIRRQWELHFKDSLRESKAEVQANCVKVWSQLYPRSHRWVHPELDFARQVNGFVD